MKILILGAGPCGLGAAFHLNKLGHTDWQIFERNGLPYPFQNNVRYLPDEALKECVEGLRNLNAKSDSATNFQEWMTSVFGEDAKGKNESIFSCFLRISVHGIGIASMPPRPPLTRKLDTRLMRGRSLHRSGRCEREVFAPCATR